MSITIPRTWRFYIVTKENQQITLTIQKCKKPAQTKIWKTMQEHLEKEQCMTWQGRASVKEVAYELYYKDAPVGFGIL